MVSVEAAKKILDSICSNISLKTTSIQLSESRGAILASDVKSPVDSPNFEQSAMDGYAVRFSSEKMDQQFILDRKIESKAGTSKKIFLNKGEAIPIYTGAPTPINADCVIPFEFTTTDKNSKTFSPKKEFFKRDNIRTKGSHFKKTEILIKKGTEVLPAHIALMATAGIKTIKAVKQPVVGILICGNEFCAQGKKLIFGQIYESNSIMLSNLLNEDGINNPKLYFAKDTEKDIQSKLQKLIRENDIVLIAGGMSVGNYDLVTKVLEKIKAETIFYKVKQKPGKPFAFFRKGKTFIFGLPGNPGAAMMCYLIYARPFIAKLSGKPGKIKTEVKNLIGSYKKKEGITGFLNVRIEGNNAIVLDNQESYKLTSFIHADAIIEFPEHLKHIENGTELKCYKY